MAPRTRVKERAEEQASAMNTDQQAAIRIVANDLHRLNQSVMKAVEAGVSVELVRSARHHGGNGNWGDSADPRHRYPRQRRLIHADENQATLDARLACARF